MNKLTLSLIAFGFSSLFSFASQATDTSCADGVYCVEEMVCVVSMKSPPQSMHPDFHHRVIEIKTFKSTRRDGSLVDSLQMGDFPAGPTKPSLQQAWDQADFLYGNYGRPMTIHGLTVTLSWGPTSNFSEGVNLEIVGIKKGQGYRVHRLRGTEVITGDVVGSFRQNYECEAHVVDELSRVDDYTR